MNRRDRRRAAAQARRARRPTGYLHRLTAAHDAIVAAGRGRLVHLVCQHDPGCSIYTARRRCNCLPEMSARVDGTGTVSDG